jgi:hypothetical protein
MYAQVGIDEVSKGHKMHRRAFQGVRYVACRTIELSGHRGMLAVYRCFCTTIYYLSPPDLKVFVISIL